MTIAGHVPSKSNCYRIVTVGGHGSLAKTKPLKEYERSFYIQCPHRGIMIKGYFTLEANVYYESQRPDLDNALKIILDCLQSCKVIDNDRYCTEIHACKFVDKDDPRVEIVIRPVDI